jgi:A/G-specific adenine glycosylase
MLFTAWAPRSRVDGHIAMRPGAVEEFQIAMLDWYRRNGRDLPWRVTDDPYKIMVAELLLQKTDVEKVKMVYERFVAQWPDIRSLDVADFHAVAGILQPLGLRYKTARLESLARIIVSRFGGRIPETTKMLLELPGVGRYIASSIECFAYSKRTAILDTNIVRIIDRVLGMSSQKRRPRDDPHLWDLAQGLLPHHDVKEYNWALLDFGSIVCKSKKPLCDTCTLRGICRYRRSNIAGV